MSGIWKEGSYLDLLLAHQVQLINPPLKTRALLVEFHLLMLQVHVNLLIIFKLPAKAPDLSVKFLVFPHPGKGLFILLLHCALFHVRDLLLEVRIVLVHLGVDTSDLKKVK